MDRHGKSRSMDMLHGPLWGKILIFALPLIASGVLQQSFNAVDVAVIGHYSNSHAIAAVGSNGPVINILVNLFLGVAVGANVVISTYLGQRNHEAVRRSVSTVMVVAVASGLILLMLGATLARPILEAMSAPPDVLDLATRYLRIYFCGMPFMMIYNFGSAIMRSIGDTNRPFYSLLIATLFNFVLDWIFVAIFDMGVDGVAWATVIASAFNAAIMVMFLVREPDPVTLNPRVWALSRPDLKKMLQIGIPAGLQGMVFSISNIFIQAAINKFGADAIAGSSTALTYEAYCYYIVSAFAQATIAFTGQNFGAGQHSRCKQTVRICMIYGLVLSAAADALLVCFSKESLGLFTSDAEVIGYAEVRFHTVLVFQWLVATYEISGSYMRGLGYSLTPMLLTIFGTCLLRLIWVGIFPRFDNTFAMLLNIYPISWIITGVIVISAALYVQKLAFAKGVSPAQ